MSAPTPRPGNSAPGGLPPRATSSGQRPPTPHANNDSTAHAAPPSTATPSMVSPRP